MSYEQYFHSSYKEKIENGKERILGIVVEKDETVEENNCYVITPVHNLKDKDVEYYIYILDKNGEKTVITDWFALDILDSSSETDSFKITVEEDFKEMHIEARPEGTTETTNFVQINE